MFKLDVTITGVPPAEIDGAMVETAMETAARALMRRSGGKRGENLIGVTDAAQAAAEAEIQRQIDEGASE